MAYQSIWALYQDEAPYMREWVEFHRLMGVEHFYAGAVREALERTRRAETTAAAMLVGPPFPGERSEQGH
jgi:hypothetical protein